MPAFIGIFLFLLSACFAVASFHHTSSLLAVPISLSGFKKVSRNNESVPDKRQVINPLLSSSYSKKTGMSLGHSVHAAPCCLSILFDRGTQNKAAQFLENSRLVISHLKCSWSLVSLCLLLHQQKSDALSLENTRTTVWAVFWYYWLFLVSQKSSLQILP